MPTNPNKLSQFWQELKRRKVVRVITVYAGAAFVIIELINNITEPLKLPEWTPTLVIVLLAIGFPIAIIFSWIYDIHPAGGIVKTKPSKAVSKGEKTATPNSWRIATYVSLVVIFGLLILNIVRSKNRVKIDESLGKSIAVLPFHNYSGDPDQDYMCLGLTDEIISHLFKVQSFDEVRSRTSVLPYKDSEQSINEIAQKLQVTYILEGSYKRMGKDLKITAKLIEPKSDKHIWYHDYELPYKEIPGIPGEIAMQIANHLKAFVSEEIQQSIEKIPTDNVEAYELMQQAISLFNSDLSIINFSNRYQVRDLAERAIGLDPDYAHPHALMGMSLLMDGIFLGDKEMKSVAWEAESYTERAIEIDPFNLLANYVNVAINYIVKWEYEEVDETLLKFPNIRDNEIFNASIPQLFFLQMGRYETAISWLNQENSDSEYGIKTYVLLGDTARARKMLNMMISEHVSAKYTLAGELFIWLQEFDSALNYLKTALGSEINAMQLPRFQADLALAYLKTGQPDLSRSTIGKLISKSDTTSVGSPSYFVGWYYSWAGERDSAFYWLKKAVENRSAEMPWLKVDPAFNSLKDDDRYRDLYERTGHKAYDEYMANKQQ
jgi:TolB-like protein